MRDGELGGKAHDSLVMAVGVDARDRVVHAEVDAAVGDDARHRDAEAVVQTHDARRTLGGLDQAVCQAVEGLLRGADVGCQSGSCVICGVGEKKGEVGGVYFI